MMMTGEFFGEEEEEEGPVNLQSRRLLSGVICAVLLLANMGAAVMAQTPVAGGTPAGGAAASATPGQPLKMVLLPKFLGILPFDQAHQGRRGSGEGAGKPNSARSSSARPPENSVAGQIEIMTNATTPGRTTSIMISNNSGDQIVPAAKAAQARASRS